MIIEVLYPEICLTNGDNGNVKYIKANFPNAKIIYTKIDDKPYFVNNKVDLLYMGNFILKYEKIIVSELTNYKSELMKYIDNNGLLLFTGSAGVVLSKDNLGIFDYSTSKLKTFKHSLYRGTFENIDIIGYKNVTYFIDNNKNNFIKNSFGLGNNESDLFEGVHYNNVYITNLLGPFLIYNPDFAYYLFKKLDNKFKSLTYKKEIYDIYNIRLKEYKEL